jgi:hypothetical protein
VDGACRTGKVKDPVHLEQDGLRHIVGDKLETGVWEEVEDILLGSRKEIVKAQDFVAI